MLDKSTCFIEYEKNIFIKNHNFLIIILYILLY